MKRILLSGALLVAVGVFLVLTVGAGSPSPVGKYWVNLDNAFGLTSGSDFKVAGVPAGKIGKIELPQGCSKGGGDTACYAHIQVTVTQRGFAQFRTDAFCQSRPQSLIGEYFIDCTPGTKGKVLPPGSTIPRKNTQSTIPFDLLQNINQLPYRQRLALIVNELGATVAGRSGDLEQALRRAVPALTETDNLLNLLANDSRTLQQLTSDSNTVLTALANNSKQVQRFIDEANNTSRISATQAGNISATWARFPGFLEQLRPTMAKLGAAADANTPVLRNLLSTAGQLHTLFTNLASCDKPHNDSQCGFANASLPALQALGKASVVGKSAVQAASPTIKDLNRMTGPTNCLQHDIALDKAGQGAGGANSPMYQTCLPELAQNLSIVLHDLDDRGRAIEPDTRSPGGKGFTGLEALLWYTFVQPLSINTYTQYGHILSVNAFVDPRCSQYATPQRIANGLAQYGASYRECYAWYGPNQPGVNEPDPSNPSACVPDPNGAPPNPNDHGPNKSACKLPASASGALTGQPSGGGSSPIPGAASDTGSASSSGASTGASPAANAATNSGGSSGSGSSGSGNGGGQSQQLLNYLLSP
jgi:virulence factor Mce-like protein